MKKDSEKKSYMDYRNCVPFIDLSGYIVKQPIFNDEMPPKSLQDYLHKKKFSTMINLKRLEYCMRVEGFKNGKF